MTRRFERRRRIEHSKPRHDRWLVSYADFVTLMFAFFTTMYAISSVDAQKLDTVAESLSVAFDQPAVPTVPLAQVLDPTVLEAAARARELSGLRERLMTVLEDDMASDLVDIRLDGRGLVISLQEAGAFATGSADLSGSAQGLIGTVGAAIQDLDNIVRVEGHTDDVPIFTSQYRSNWELSTARATSVIAYLVDEMQIPSERLAVAGYGEFRPLAPNDSDANRALNRRVDIVVLSTETARTEEPVGVITGDGDA
jgi:chemotaxis protein MotB